MNYCDIDDYYENLTEEEETEQNRLEHKVVENRSRFFLKDALEFDKSFVNELLNKDNLSKVEKHWITSMHNRTCEEFLESNETSKSFEKFVQERLGKKKYEKLVAEWLKMRGNEFFQRTGMEEENEAKCDLLLWE